MLRYRALFISVAGGVMGSRGLVLSCKRGLIPFMEGLEWSPGRLIWAANRTLGAMGPPLRAVDGFLGLSGTLIS